jgi:hypothetical protein
VERSAAELCLAFIVGPATVSGMTKSTKSAVAYRGGPQPGAGRPPMGDLKRITLAVRIRPAVHDVIRRVALTRRISYGKAIDQIVRDHLPHLKLDV